MRILPALLTIVFTVSPLLASASAPLPVNAAREQTKTRVVYDGTYTPIGYPMGDVPANKGVCTDVVIRAYRRIGIDFQVLVHEDMKAHFKHYPRQCGLGHPDKNIDHRRVPNLQKFLDRQGATIQSTALDSFKAGDLVTWMLPGNLPHIGVISDRVAPSSNRPLIIHNVGAGPVEEDKLFAYPITGHYRYKVR